MKTLNQIIAKDDKLVVLTGAGVSVPSGIPPFRGPDGLYNNADVVHFLSIGYFHRDPEAFWNFYRSLFDADLLLSAVPNEVHKWLKRLEKDRQVTIITQNIDGLHIKAGSSHVIEMHGSFSRAVCPKCGTVYQTEAILHEPLPCCTSQTGSGQCRAVLKPDIVLFGEAVHDYEEAEQAARNADRLIVLGSSLTVTPASLLPVHAKMAGVPTVLVNNRPAEHMNTIDQFVKMDFSRFDPNQ
ncbi:NAD-dependent deacylase [Sporolactobacillus sp. THM7-4]|nr:NAD-dependent deacylase [Sporolactobacillus sp. THM7-4]